MAMVVELLRASLLASGVLPAAPACSVDEASGFRESVDEGCRRARMFLRRFGVLGADVSGPPRG